MGMDEVGDERAEFLYLSQIDVGMVGFMRHRKTLIADLVTRLLLESNVVITDSFFFTSRDVLADIERSESWILRGLRRGLIVPAFRAVNVGSFEDGWVRGGFQSSLGVLSDGGRIANALDNAIGSHTAPRITWPDRVGASYGELMNRQFAGDVAEDALPDSMRSGLWRETRDMRRKYLELAWQRSDDRELNGLRRADLYTVIAKDVGFDGAADDMQKVIGRADPDKRDAVRATLLWVDELYHYNHATRFRVRPSFPVSNGPGALVIPELLVAKPGRAGDSGSAWAYSHGVRWPSRDALRAADPDTLLGLASDEIGRAYHNWLSTFRAQRTDATWYEFTRSADRYSEEICNAIGPVIETALQIRHIVGPDLALRPVLTAGGITGPEPGPASTAIASMSDDSATLYTPTDDFERATRGAGIAEIPLQFRASETGDFRVDLQTAS
jgi:hypothetical protein